MHSLIDFFSNFAFAQMLLSVILLLPLWQRNPSVRLYILLMLSGCGYILGGILAPSDPYSLVWWVGFLGGNALPGAFWLVSLSVFGDHVVLKRGQYLLASLTLMIPLSAVLCQFIFSFNLSDYSEFNGLIKYGAMLLELVLISHALVTAAKYWRDDLVQERRYIRGGVISVSALYIFMVIFLEQLLGLDWLILNQVKAVLLAILITAINFFLFNLRPSNLFETVKNNPEPETLIPASSPELARIVAAMAEDKLYQQDGITISGLARHLSIHEYKLRHLINGEMNYRNFNDFLNYYRIKEVTEFLAKVECSSTPVLTLALESGFRSLSSFNKAFKNTHGITPTEYRKKILKGSG